MIPNGELVTFYDGTTSLGTAALVNGSAIYTTPALPAGTHAITAVYGGDGAFQPATGTLQGGQTVNPAGRKATGQEAPQQEQKSDGAGGQRTTITESKK